MILPQFFIQFESNYALQIELIQSGFLQPSCNRKQLIGRIQQHILQIMFKILEIFSITLLSSMWRCHFKMRIIPAICGSHALSFVP